MLSAPPTARDLRAIEELITTQRDTLGDEQRERLRAMAVVDGPPYELTTRGRTIVAGLLSLALVACGGAPFELGQVGPDTGAIGPDVAPALDAGAGDAVRRVESGTTEASADALGAQDVAGDAQAAADTRSADVATVDQVGPDAAPDASALRDVAAGDALDAGPAPDVSSPQDAPSCSNSQSYSFQTGPTGCMCETPETYSCFAWGVVCGTCPPVLDASAFGHADGSCASPNVCRVGAPCAWQAPSGAVIAGSVLACP